MRKFTIYFLVVPIVLFETYPAIIGTIGIIFFMGITHLLSHTIIGKLDTTIFLIITLIADYFVFLFGLFILFLFNEKARKKLSK